MSSVDTIFLKKDGSTEFMCFIEKIQSLTFFPTGLLRELIFDKFEFVLPSFFLIFIAPAHFQLDSFFLSFKSILSACLLPYVNVSLANIATSVNLLYDVKTNTNKNKVEIE